jgi:transcriptional regulator with XRE-family HTH domain
MDVTASTQTQLEVNDISLDLRNYAVKERCIYPNLKLRIYTTGMRQNRLAKLVGIDEAYLSRIVNGVRVPGLHVRQQIANVLECSAEWLFQQTTVEAPSRTVRENTQIAQELFPR